ncbi:MAG: hypothetical protein QM679_12060, partial [Patulibacter sp.]
ALLVGDWAYAHALQALAQTGDLPAIGRLADAIGACAALLGDGRPATADQRLAEIWANATADLAAPAPAQP